MEFVMEKKEGTLVPLDKYISYGVQIGTKFKTKYMKPFIFKIREDGLVILDVQKIDERLRIASKFLAKFDPKDILVVGRRENAHKPIKMFGKITGAKVMVGRYLPGSLTNPSYEFFIEPEVVLITDPWVDRNALKDAYRTNKVIVALVDSNNNLNYIDLAIPCNNKGKRSLALVYWILAREYLLNRGLIKSREEFNYKIEDFIQK